MAVPEPLPVWYNCQTKEFTNKGGDELSRYIETVVKAFRAETLRGEGALKELTPELYEHGTCNSQDYRFCLLLLLPAEAESDIEAKKQAFLRVRRAFQKEPKDPLRVFYMVSSAHLQATLKRLS